MENTDPFTKFTFIPAKNGGKYLLYNGYSYKLNKKTPTTWYLACSTKCGVTMTVFPDYAKIKKFPTNLHSHAPVDTDLEKNQKIVEKMKKDVRYYQKHLRKSLCEECPFSSTAIQFGKKYPLPYPSRKASENSEKPEAFYYSDKMAQNDHQKKLFAET